MDQKKIEKLKEILRKAETNDPAAVKAEAKEFLKTVDSEELIQAEQAIMDEGIKPEAMGHLCAAHLEMMGGELSELKKSVPTDHPIATLIAEHEEILNFLEKLDQISVKLRHADKFEDISEEVYGKISHITHHLVAAEKHHQREEEVLFPEVEKYGIYGPPQIMVEEHKTLRVYKHDLEKLAQERAGYKFDEFREKFLVLAGELVQNLRDHIFKENNILYPAALKVIPAENWKKIKEDADKIGYCCFTPGYLK